MPPYKAATSRGMYNNSKRLLNGVLTGVSAYYDFVNVNFSNAAPVRFDALGSTARGQEAPKLNAFEVAGTNAVTPNVSTFSKSIDTDWSTATAHNPTYNGKGTSAEFYAMAVITPHASAVSSGDATVFLQILEDGVVMDANTVGFTKINDTVSQVGVETSILQTNYVGHIKKGSVYSLALIRGESGNIRLDVYQLQLSIRPVVLNT